MAEFKIVSIQHEYPSTEHERHQACRRRTVFEMISQ